MPALIDTQSYAALYDRLSSVPDFLQGDCSLHCSSARQKRSLQLSLIGLIDRLNTGDTVVRLFGDLETRRKLFNFFKKRLTAFSSLYSFNGKSYYDHIFDHISGAI